MSVSPRLHVFSPATWTTRTCVCGRFLRDRRHPWTRSVTSPTSSCSGSALAPGAERYAWTVRPPSLLRSPVVSSPRSASGTSAARAAGHSATSSDSYFSVKERESSRRGLRVLCSSAQPTENVPHDQRSYFPTSLLYVIPQAPHGKSCAGFPSLVLAMRIVQFYFSRSRTPI